METRDRASYEPNSHVYKEQKKAQKEIKPVVQNATVRKKSKLKVFADGLFANDAQTIKDYIIKDVVKPKILDLLYSMGVGSLGMLLLGEDRSTSSKANSAYKYDKPSYATPYHTVANKRKDETEKRVEYDDIIFRTERDAADVLYFLKEYIDDDGKVSLLSFYELSGVNKDTLNFTDDSYGWYDLNGVTPVRIKTADGHGWILNLPRPRLLR